MCVCVCVMMRVAQLKADLIMFTTEIVKSVLVAGESVFVTVCVTRGVCVSSIKRRAQDPDAAFRAVRNTHTHTYTHTKANVCFDVKNSKTPQNTCSGMPADFLSTK